MFGNVIANLQDLNNDETKRYQSLYCGLCHTIKERYGHACTTVLSFDLTFFVLLLNALYEPEEQKCAGTCIAHPLKEREYATSIFTDYAADLSILFAYHKCLDDWQDDKSVTARAGAQLLKAPYQKALMRRPEQGAAIEQALRDINTLEQQGATSLDAAASCFGWLMGELLGYQDDFWRDALQRFGGELGRFIYAMDAATDYEEDSASGSYNPFVINNVSLEQRELMLKVLIGRAAEQFEKLPIVEDEHLIQSVLYAGVWQQYFTVNKESLSTFAGSCEDHSNEKSRSIPERETDSSTMTMLTAKKKDNNDNKCNNSFPKESVFSTAREKAHT